MTKKEYLKYHQVMYDMYKKLLKPGDTVVMNDSYSSTPRVGKVDHFTASGKVAIVRGLWTSPSTKIVLKEWAYRPSHKLIKLRSERKKKE